MSDYKEDVLKAYSLLASESAIFTNWNWVFYSTNEDIKNIVKYFDFNDKSVLSVLASGDQAFYLLNNGAREVDLFDNNSLTIYYFYLRIWTIRYLNRFYPDLHLDYKFVKKLLDKVIPKNSEEENAYNYWETILKSKYRKNLSKLVYKSAELDNQIYDLDYLKDRLENLDFNFKCIDISEECDFDRRYDIIYTSNIVDWIKYNPNFVKIYRDNLYNGLTDNGTVISSLVTAGYIDEIDIFNEKFKFCPLTENDGKKICCDPGYSFVKRK